MVLIESYCLNYPYFEMIYYEESDHNSTYMRAAYHLINTYCARRYEYTACLESYDWQKEDLTQRYIPLPFHAWLDQVPTTQKERLLTDFVSFCQNVDSTAMVNFFP